MDLQVISKFGETDHNWHSHVFDDVICKPPIQKGTDMFTVLIRRTCSGLHENCLTPIRL